MTTRITLKQLDSQCAAINRLTASPDTYSKDGIPQVGHYYISRAYGGFSLARVYSAGGGKSEPLDTGHIPARRLSELMFAFATGLRCGKESS